MSTFRNPVGPQSSRVYWRRRLIVGLGALAVIVIIVLIVVKPGSGAPTPTPSVSQSSGSSLTPDPATTGSTNAAGENCDPAKVTLAPVTDATGYDAGVNPVLSFTLKSTMTVPCLFAAGSDLQEFIVTSGDERIWSSKDCQTDAVAATITLQPGVPFAGSSLPWDRTRSSTDTCTTERPQVIAGGASYHLQVKIGDLASAGTAQFLLY